MVFRGTRFFIWRFCPDDFLSPFLFKNVNFFCSNIFFVQNCVCSNFYLFENFRFIPKNFCLKFFLFKFFLVRIFSCLIFFCPKFCFVQFFLFEFFFSEELVVQIFISFEFLIQASFSQNLHFSLISIFNPFYGLIVLMKRVNK